MIPKLKKSEKVTWLAENQKKFCVLPWINLNTNPDGKLKLCCNIQINDSVLTFNKNDVLTPFNIGYHSIDEIWNSEYMKTVREQQLSNVGSSACRECYKVEELTGHSPRTGQNDEWLRRKQQNKDIESTIDTDIHDESIELEHMPISLELRLGNQCNLQCISCWGLSSSLTHDERAGYLDSGVLNTPEMSWIIGYYTKHRDTVDNTDLKDWFETDMFYENFKKIAPTLKRLYTTGGEPTLIKANYKMFQMLLDAGNTDCQIEFTSNMTTWNPEFYSRLEQFKNVEMQMSIDGIDEIGEYLRYPSEWNKVSETIEKAVKLAAGKPGWRIKCYTVLQALNFKNVENIWEYLHNLANEYEKPILWWPITLTAPFYLSLAAVSVEERKNHIETIKSTWKTRYYDVTEQALFQLNDIVWENYYNTIMNSPYNPKYHDQLKNYIKFMDQQRQLDGELIFGDLL
jgi:organic radical activating enzyme